VTMGFLGQLYALRGTARIARFRLTHHRGSLEPAIRHLSRAAALLPAAHEDRPLVLAGLSNALIWRYELDSAPADLDRAIASLRMAMASPGVSRADRAGFGADLAAMLRSRFVLDGQVRHLDEAVEAATEAVRHAPDPASAITNLAVVLVARYEETARLADLVQALEYARRPVRGPVARALHGGMRLGALVDALSSRYHYTDDPEDLAAAVAAGREALATLSRIDPYRTQYASLLSEVLWRDDDPASRSEAVAVAEDVLRDSDPAGVDHALHLSALSTALFMRYAVAPDPADLERAATMAEKAFAATPAGHRNRPIMLQRIALTARFRHLAGDASALERGERALREALTLVEPDNPLWCLLTEGLAGLLLEPPETAERVAEARELLAAVVRTGTPITTLQHAFRAATRLGEVAAEAGDTEQALVGYRRAVELLPLAAWPGLRRQVREARLAEAPRATDAAAQAVRAGDPMLAVELLEAGRSVIWGQQLDLRTDLTRLRSAAPELADRLNEIRIWFEQEQPDR
jgi:tetratricopeptide (TPR) repeat protein